jgi:endonuclease/exonuclease/phosphatase family metal-dependent hydrolase
MRRGTLLLLASLLSAGASAQGEAEPDHTFSVLTYNVAGLPEGISGSTPFLNTVQISPLLDAFDLVAVQEDFAYHEDLVSALRHPHHSVKDTRPGRWGELVGYAFGDGLSTFSRAPFSYFTRITWNDCFGTFSNGSDCLTPKGFSVARVWLARGVFVDVYDWHADSGNAPEDQATRRANVRQLAAFVAASSAGNAVIVLGDTNSRYTRAGDVLPELLATALLTDVWVELERGGVVPPVGPTLRSGCDADPAGGECERVDKILYRSGARVELTAIATDVPAHFVDAAGAPLSDHQPLSARFSWRVLAEPEAEAPSGAPGTGAP